MSTTMSDKSSAGAESTGQPYLVVSGDSHAGPALETDLRPYCPEQYLEEFDRFAAEYREAASKGQRAWSNNSFAGQAHKASDELDVDVMTEEARKEGLDKLARVLANPGSMDVHARLADMDEQGVTSEVIFAGAQNRQVLPWAGGTDAGSAAVSPELRIVGGHMWNQWLADFCSAAPERLLGVAQIPIWDVDAAVKEIQWAADHGLRAINFPAPRPDYPSYNETDVYEPLWSVAEETGMPLVTHSASGESASGGKGEGATMVFHAENLWLSRRGLSQLIFGKVFDRHPGLIVCFMEQRGNWVQHTLNELDSQCLGGADSGTLALLGAPMRPPKRLPSEYWRSNCIIADSFMAPYEAAMRHEIGIETLMWGSDYPHIEGTWPNTQLALRNTFAGIPEDEVRMILGSNGARAFRLDTKALQPIVDRIGPKPEELAKPLGPDEFPAYRGYSFRRGGSYH